MAGWEGGERDDIKYVDEKAMEGLRGGGGLCEDRKSQKG